MQVEVDAYGRRLALNRPLIQQEDMVWDFQLFNPHVAPNTGLYGASVARPDFRADGGCGACAQAPCSSWVSYMQRVQHTDPRGPVYTVPGGRGTPVYPSYTGGKFLTPHR